MFLPVFSVFIYGLLGIIYAVPPEACFANFRSDDCGRTPEPVMYYYKPGSRCEVGIWRGCLPNPNMFKDQYECVQTCIFNARAVPEDYHKINEEPGQSEEIKGSDESDVGDESGDKSDIPDEVDSGGDSVNDPDIDVTESDSTTNATTTNATTTVPTSVNDTNPKNPDDPNL